MDAKRWPIEHVVAVAPTPRSFVAAQALAAPTLWNGLGGDERALWGNFLGSAHEPYHTMVDHRGATVEHPSPDQHSTGRAAGAATSGWRCSCPSRQRPCKHALALLIMWINGEVPQATRAPDVASWIDERDRRAAGRQGAAAGRARPRGDDDIEQGPTDISTTDRSSSQAVGSSGGADRQGDAAGGGDTPEDGDGGPGHRRQLDRSRDERVGRMSAGLVELQRWIEDRVRTGLADPSIANYDTWDGLAARLVDAQVGSLANRVRRVAGLVGGSPDWHDQVLAELGLLHLLASAGQRLGDLPSRLADSVALALGWQVRQSVVLGLPPVHDRWLVAGRSDLREDRIEVRRHWLRSLTTGEWAMVLSFAAYQQSLDNSMTPGTVIEAEIYRYPGYGLRALIGERRDLLEQHTPTGVSIAAAVDEIGVAVAREPWLDRYCATVLAQPTLMDRRWVLTDHTGSLAIAARGRTTAALVAAADAAVTVTIEWTPNGVQPLTLHLADRTLDIARRADEQFVDATVPEAVS